MRHAFLMMLFATGALAETVENLDWRQCLALAREHNPDLAAAQASVDSARFASASARSVFQPSADGRAGFNRSDQSGDESDASDQSSVGVDAAYSLYSGGGNRARVAQADSQLRAAEADWRDALAFVSADLKQNFARLLYAQADIALTRQIAERLKQNVDLVELRYESGKEHRGSLLRTRATYRDAEADEHRAARALRVAQRALATSLGRDQFDVLIAEGHFILSLAPGAPEFHQLLRETPDHQRAEAEVQSADAAVRLARSPFYPDLGAQASASQSGDDLKPEDDAWSIGLVLSFPFYAGRKYQNDLAAARADARRSLARLQGVDEQTLAALETAWADFEDALERREVEEQFLEAAQVRAEIARKQYAGGLLSFEDWDRIEDDLINAQKSMLASQRDVVLAEANWERTRGINLFQLP